MIQQDLRRKDSNWPGLSECFESDSICSLRFGCHSLVFRVAVLPCGLSGGTLLGACGCHLWKALMLVSHSHLVPLSRYCKATTWFILHLDVYCWALWAGSDAVKRPLLETEQRGICPILAGKVGIAKAWARGVSLSWGNMQEADIDKLGLWKVSKRQFVVWPGQRQVCVQEPCVSSQEGSPIHCRQFNFISVKATGYKCIYDMFKWVPKKRCGEIHSRRIALTTSEMWTG